MPEYKKKKKHHSLFNSKQNKKFVVKSQNDTDFDIKMNISSKSSNKEKKKNDINVIKGKKPRRKFQFKTILICLVSVFLIFAVLSFVYPVGIIESFNNLVYTVGKGEYPTDLFGTQIVDTCDQNNYYFVLTDSWLYSVSDYGKKILSTNHGYSKPVIKTSFSRALVYGQSENTYSIYSIKECLLSSNTEQGIITGDICDSGVYALASYSSEYTSCVSVFDKNGNIFFNFNCAKEYINNVSLSPNGKKMAISTLNAKNGELSSRVYFFDLSKTDAKETFDYGTMAVNSLKSNGYGFFVVTQNKYDFVNWSKGERTENTVQNECNIIRTYNKQSLIVLNRESNRSDNTVICLDKKGKKLNEFSVDGNINDIRIKNSHIYCISDSKVLIFDIEGKLVCSKNCGYDYKKIIPCGSYSAVIISDTQIEKFVLQ